MTTGKGYLLAGRYLLLEQVDSGGSAYIFRARDELSGQIVAVKMLRPELTENEEFVGRFKKEVQAALKLRHANIIRAYDAGLDDGKYYIVMDLIEGKTLKHLINVNGPLPIKYVVSVAKKLCLALEYAHVKGFVHRDIKPHNVMVDMTGEPYIADFGIAKNLAQNTMTVEEENVMGSVHYFSPEQARGERVDKRSDLYSLGILIYEMLTGKVPYDADSSVAIALQHINDPMPDPGEEVPGVQESIKKIILKATQKDKHFRYKSAFGMYEDLQRALSEPDGEYVKYTESKRTQQHIEEVRRKRSKRSLGRMFLTIGVGLGAAAAIIYIATSLLSANIIKYADVPLVIGQGVEQATAELQQTGFTVDMAYEFSNQPEGSVIGQQPEAGSELQQGGGVVLTVSKGAGTQVMPDVTNISLEQAQEMLKGAGIEVTDVRKTTEGEAAIGFVTEQSPAAGEPASGAVFLTVKASPDEYKILLPDVAGKPLEAALGELRDAEFTEFFIYEEESDASPDTVFRQDPVAGTEYSASQPVRLYVPKNSANPYTYQGSVSINVPEDQTTVAIAVARKVGDTTVYYVINEKVEAAGEIEKQLDIKISLIGEGPTLERSLVVFLNNEIRESRPIKFEKAGEAE